MPKLLSELSRGQVRQQYKLQCNSNKVDCTIGLFERLLRCSSSDIWVQKPLCSLPGWAMHGVCWSTSSSSDKDLDGFSIPKTTLDVTKNWAVQTFEFVWISVTRGNSRWRKTDLQDRVVFLRVLSRQVLMWWIYQLHWWTKWNWFQSMWFSLRFNCSWK